MSNDYYEGSDSGEERENMKYSSDLIECCDSYSKSSIQGNLKGITYFLVFVLLSAVSYDSVLYCNERAFLHAMLFRKNLYQTVL